MIEANKEFVLGERRDKSFPIRLIARAESECESEEHELDINRE